MAAIPKLLCFCGCDFILDAECECRLGFLALVRWCRQWCLVGSLLSIA